MLLFIKATKLKSKQKEKHNFVHCEVNNKKYIIFDVIFINPINFKLIFMVEFVSMVTRFANFNINIVITNNNKLESKEIK